jgi:hypothetical protein
MVSSSILHGAPGQRMMATMPRRTSAATLMGFALVLATPSAGLADPPQSSDSAGAATMPTAPVQGPVTAEPASPTPPPQQVVTIIVPADPPRPVTAPARKTTPASTDSTAPATTEGSAARQPAPPRVGPRKLPRRPSARGGQSVLLVDGGRSGRVIEPRSRGAEAAAPVTTFRRRPPQSTATSLPRWLLAVLAALGVAEASLLARFAWKRRASRRSQRGIPGTTAILLATGVRQASSERLRGRRRWRRILRKKP